MRILILSFYYPPDLGPGSLRAKSLFDGLMNEMKNSLYIDLMTTSPNRYNTYSPSSPKIEKSKFSSIYRFNITIYRNNLLCQSIAFFIYAWNVIKITRGKRYDLVLATTSRLMTGTLGAWVAKRSNAKFYLDLRDLFTDNLKNALNFFLIKFLIKFFKILEKWTFCSADKINIISPGFLNYVKKVVPSKVLSVYTNGVDEEFIIKNHDNKKKNSFPLVLYVGTIGVSQGLHKLFSLMDNSWKKKAHFLFIGDGTKKKDLQKLISNKLWGNLKILNPMSRYELLYHYKKADILLLYLDNFESLDKVLPSKIFEYAATGKPILAGVDGYAAKFLDENIDGVEIFKPCDIQNMKIAFLKLLKGPKNINRSSFCSTYSRKNIMKKMSKDILDLF